MVLDYRYYRCKKGKKIYYYRGKEQYFAEKSCTFLQHSKEFRKFHDVAPYRSIFISLNGIVHRYVCSSRADENLNQTGIRKKLERVFRTK